MKNSQTHQIGFRVKYRRTIRRVNHQNIAHLFSYQLFGQVVAFPIGIAASLIVDQGLYIYVSAVTY